MTDEQLTAIEQCANAATPGPWAGYPSMVSIGLSHALHILTGIHPFNQAQATCDTTFIAAARSDVPALVAEVRRLGEELWVVNGNFDVAQKAIDFQALEIVKLRADIERIGAELATQRNANAELQARLSALQRDGSER